MYVVVYSSFLKKELNENTHTLTYQHIDSIWTYDFAEPKLMSAR